MGYLSRIGSRLVVYCGENGKLLKNIMSTHVKMSIELGMITGNKFNSSMNILNFCTFKQSCKVTCFIYKMKPKPCRKSNVSQIRNELRHVNFNTYKMILFEFLASNNTNLHFDLQCFQNTNDKLALQF